VEKPIVLASSCQVYRQPAPGLQNEVMHLDNGTPAEDIDTATKASLPVMPSSAW
jgi:hypothetical protein